MPGFSRNQARVAKALASGPKTVKELRDELGLPLNEVEADLAKLITLRVVEKLGGYPTKYQAVEAVRRGVMGTKATEAHVFRAHIIIEGQSLEKKALEDGTKDLSKKLLDDKVVAVSNIKEAPVVDDKGVFTNMIEADVAGKRFEDLVYAALTFGPSSIELQPLGEYTLRTDEAQGVIMDIANVIHAYASALVQKDIMLRELSAMVQQYKKRSPEVFIK